MESKSINGYVFRSNLYKTNHRSSKTIYWLFPKQILTHNYALDRHILHSLFDYKFETVFSCVVRDCTSEAIHHKIWYILSDNLK